jgi:hypothetical protein
VTIEHVRGKAFALPLPSTTVELHPMKIHPGLTVGEVLEINPRLAPVLMGFGICILCGEHVPLGEMASALGIDVGWLVEELNRLGVGA